MYMMYTIYKLINFISIPNNNANRLQTRKWEEIQSYVQSR